MGRAQSARDAELIFLALLLRRPAAKERPQTPAPPAELESFYRAVSKFYRARQDEVRRAAARVSSAEEVAVVFHLARHAALEPDEILRLRETGIGWAGLASRLHLGRESFYVPLGSPTVTPATAYRNVREKARQAWQSAGLMDIDIVNLINLKFLYEYYGCHAEHVIALRASGWSFAAMHALLRGGGTASAKRTAARKKRAS